MSGWQKDSKILGKRKKQWRHGHCLSLFGVLGLGADRRFKLSFVRSIAKWLIVAQPTAAKRENRLRFIFIAGTIQQLNIAGNP